MISETFFATKVTTKADLELLHVGDWVQFPAGAGPALARVDGIERTAEGKVTALILAAVGGELEKLYVENPPC